MTLQKLSATIITLSDRASSGVYEDASGTQLEQILTKYFNDSAIECSIKRILIPDEQEQLSQEFQNAVDLPNDFIFTTGGTGIGPRDITPDVIKPLLTKEIPGIMEVIRVKYGLQFPAAALSRSIAGVADKSLVYCLPGSPKAVKEYVDEILLTLMHCYRMLHNEGH